MITTSTGAPGAHPPILPLSITAASAPAQDRNAYFDPADCPEPYACIAQGVCLEPVYRDGVCFVISTKERCKAGDYVVVYFRPDVVPPGNMPRMVKRLAMGLPDSLSFPFRPAPTNCLMPIVVLEQHNPPRRWSVPAIDIIAIHKVIGTAESLGNGFAAWKPSQAMEV